MTTVAAGVPVARFTDVMARLVSGVAVVTARGTAGEPCGLLVSSLCSYSVAPPSVLAVIDRAARSYAALRAAPEFGVHLLTASQTELARVFAGRSPHKFDAVPWEWDGTVPRLAGPGDYLRCRTDTVLDHGDHAIVIGRVSHCAPPPEAARPLVYYGRVLGWRLTPPD